MADKLKNTIFNPHTVDENAFLLASHLPQGRLWGNAFKPESIFGKLILGLAVEFYRFEVLVNQLYGEMDINQANELLVDWEKSVGLPDSCFNTTVSIVERRKQVLQKFSNFGGVQKAEDFVRVGAVFGFDLTVTPYILEALFPIVFPLEFAATPKEARHTILVIINGDLSGGEFFPLPFPIPFSSGGRNFLQCIFNVLAPANVRVIIKTEGEL